MEKILRVSGTQFMFCLLILLLLVFFLYVVFWTFSATHLSTNSSSLCERLKLERAGPLHHKSVEAVLPKD